MIMRVKTGLMVLGKNDGTYGSMKEICVHGAPRIIDLVTLAHAGQMHQGQ